MNVEQDTFECEELNLVKVTDWGDTILYAAYRNPNALEDATRQAFKIMEEWNKLTGLAILPRLRKI